MTLINLNKVATKIQLTEKCINFTILKLEYQIQIITFQTLYFIASYISQTIYIKVFIINNSILVLWIILNLIYFQNLPVFILASICYKNNDPNILTKQFAKIIITMNLVVITKFFITIYTSYFKRLLNTKSEENNLLIPISTYFKTVKTNDQKILYLNCLIWLYKAFICLKYKDNYKQILYIL